MPLIKPETRNSFDIFLSTKRGESIFILLLGGAIWMIWIYFTGSVIVYVSDLLYPFSYLLFPLPIYKYAPKAVIASEPLSNYLFGSLFVFCVYRFEKNVFFRRFKLWLKSVFAAIGAAAFVFISSLLKILFTALKAKAVSFFFIEAVPEDLPVLLGFYFLYSLPIIKICDLVRRRIFVLP